MICFYHDDNDGVFAAGLVAHSPHLPDEWKKGRFVAVDYDRPFPVESVGLNEKVWILDYSPSPEDLLAIWNRTKDLVWIDHHRSTLVKFGGNPNGVTLLADVPGIRHEGVAACMLTWLWLEPARHPAWVPQPCAFSQIACDELIAAAPAAIKLVADRDVWTFEYGNITRNYHAGVALFGRILRFHPAGSLMKAMLSPGAFDDPQITPILEQGAIVQEYRRQFYEDYVARHGFEALFDGREVLAVNISSVGGGSDIFGGMLERYPLCIAYVERAGCYRVSLYSAREEVDVSVIAAQFGGGGHLGAAGFTMDSRPPLCRLGPGGDFTRDVSGENVLADVLDGPEEGRGK